VGRRAREARGEAALTPGGAYRFTAIAHAGRDLLDPVTAAAVDAMLACALERPGGRGTGVEPNPAFAADARERIERWAGAYARWGRDTMGYALIVLRRAG
jgi:hypothetical protein